MHLEAAAQMRVLAAPRDLVEGVALQRVDAAEGVEAIGIGGDLRARPVVLGLDLLVFVLDRRPVGIAVLVGQRQHERLADAGVVEQRDEILRRDRRPGLAAIGDRRAEEVLMVVSGGNHRRRLRPARPDGPEAPTAPTAKRAGISIAVFMVTPGRRTDHLRVDAHQFCPIGRVRVFLHLRSVQTLPGVRTSRKERAIPQLAHDVTPEREGL